MRDPIRAARNASPCRRTAFRTAKPVDLDARVEHYSRARGAGWLDAWITGFFEVLLSGIGGIVRLLEAPAQAVGIPAGVFAAAILLAVLVVAWRAMAKKIM